MFREGIYNIQQIETKVETTTRRVARDERALVFYLTIVEGGLQCCTHTLRCFTSAPLVLPSLSVPHVLFPAFNRVIHATIHDRPEDSISATLFSISWAFIVQRKKND